MTERLYDSDPHCREFSARVLSCRELEGSYAVTLCRSAFFPEGGGQKGDTGVLGGAAVLDTREEDGEVVHLCAAPLPVGEEVRGEIDWPQRFGRMQLHSGEHVVSGVAHSLWGCENVGFHMLEDAAVLDFDRELTEEQLCTLERRANEIVWENHSIRVWYPEKDELAALSYRSKKELSGAVRIVEIEGVDRCACCAPHVSSTGELGLLRLTDAMRHRGGMRLTLKAGVFAYEEAAARGRDAKALSALLSSPRDALPAAAERLLAELEETKAALAAERRQRMEALAAALPPTEGNRCVFVEAADMNALRTLVNTGMEKCAIFAAFAGSEGNWKYIIGSRSVDLRARAKELNAALSGRGGGSESMIQGGCAASRAEIERYFGV